MKTRTRFVCRACGHQALRWMGQCPGCKAWNTLEETTPAPTARAGSGTPPPVLETLGGIDASDAPRYCTGLGEFDRVLGGGLVPGSLVLLAGDPGIGKSTLLLQAVSAYAASGLRVLYASAEESAAQIRRRSARLHGMHDDVRVLCTTRLEQVVAALRGGEIDIAVVDSMQTLHPEEGGASPGGVAQVRENALRFMEVAKTSMIPVILVGHMTKEGGLAGPRVVEHLVDAVLYLEGDTFHHYRVLRAAKNRFGPTHEVGVFEMGDAGLRMVEDPSRILLEERSGGSGSAVVPALEGTRPLLLEIQALVAGSGYANPRRVATGVDPRRLAVLLAVLEKRAGLDFSTGDVFVNVVGGFRVVEPAVDLAVALAVASSHYDRALPTDAVFVGEVGLGGEIRAVSQLDRRLAEAAKLGFRRAIVPARGVPQVEGMELITVSRVDQAMDAVLPLTAPVLEESRR